jgi:uncharacterized membrane protein
MSAQKYLPELLDAKVIDEETAEKIRKYYRERKSAATGRLFIVFAILGSLLVGLGIILIIAHNWDSLTISVKAVLAFVPLITGQVFCGFVIAKRYENIGWREASAVFVSLAVGASIGLVSQIYHIPGNFAAFMLTWMILVLPVVYIMRSSVTSLLYICGVTVYGFDAAYGNGQSGGYLYWLLLFAVVPFYCFTLIRNMPKSNFTVMHNWFLPLSVIILLGSVADSFPSWMYPAYVSVFGILMLIGNLTQFQYENGFSNGFQVLGFLGTLVVLILLSFPDNWRGFNYNNATGVELFYSPEFIVFAGVSTIALALAIYEYRTKLLSRIPVLELFFVMFAITFFLGLYTQIAVVLINIYVLALGIWVIREGERRNHLGVLNFGLAIIGVLAISRFFDSHITFVIRGLIFLAVGVGFFVTNYRMIKKRKADA